ncbi:probable ATP-dependent helicase PF08_0048 [Xenia sp. Carnegie-2017]|uniref:probable ATP-dependent helicase PF08_0048 n=1 Tax=Xenia sp. Carnegie-2017 TaxID=2897299 RepID=UPI001F03832C|nr:probable ATP-dependent helicase PF08_0048 [Xenia sp. Carnegie-2017]
MAANRIDTNYQSELDFTSPSFNALKALHDKYLQPPVPNARIFNTIKEYARSLETEKNDLSHKKSTTNVRSESKARTKSIKLRNRDPRKLEHLMKVKSRTDGVIEKVAMLEKTKKSKQLNVLDRMESKLNQGPFSILYNCVEKKIKLKVWTRNLKGLRGLSVGYLIAFDKHMNLAMMDVDEMFVVEEIVVTDPVEVENAALRKMEKRKEKKRKWRRERRQKLRQSTFENDLGQKGLHLDELGCIGDDLLRTGVDQGVEKRMTGDNGKCSNWDATKRKSLEDQKNGEKFDFPSAELKESKTVRSDDFTEDESFFIKDKTCLLTDAKLLDTFQCDKRKPGEFVCLVKGGKKVDEDDLNAKETVICRDDVIEKETFVKHMLEKPIKQQNTTEQGCSFGKDVDYHNVGEGSCKTQLPINSLCVHVKSNRDLENNEEDSSCDEKNKVKISNRNDDQKVAVQEEEAVGGKSENESLLSNDLPIIHENFVFLCDKSSALVTDGKCDVSLSNNVNDGKEEGEISSSENDEATNHSVDQENIDFRLSIEDGNRKSIQGVSSYKTNTRTGKDIKNGDNSRNAEENKEIKENFAGKHGESKVHFASDKQIENEYENRHEKEGIKNKQLVEIKKNDSFSKSKPVQPKLSKEIDGKNLCKVFNFDQLNLNSTKSNSIVTKGSNSSKNRDKLGTKQDQSRTVIKSRHKSSAKRSSRSADKTYETSLKESGKRKRYEDLDDHHGLKNIPRSSKNKMTKIKEKVVKTVEAKLPGNVINVRVLKVKGGKALVLKKRHTNQLFIRGDNVIMTAYDKF